ncbi:hypothetical protein PEC331060_35430 [Pectobacterium carotovorum subsp. carotovorum]|nr:hypothetical protein PEC331060_35430 [Pectobacterium carotovorum subsp. carotovorum]
MRLTVLSESIDRLKITVVLVGNVQVINEIRGNYFSFIC